MIGTRVTCITDDWKDRGDHPDSKFPKEGEVYIVREALQTLSGRVGYRLVEIINPGSEYRIEIAFSSHNFRPEDKSFGEEVAEKIETEFEPELILNL